MIKFCLATCFWKTIRIKIDFTNKLVGIACILHLICFAILPDQREIAWPNLKFWIRKVFYEWYGFIQRCKTSLPICKIPLDQILLKHFLTFSCFWKLQTSGFRARRRENIIFFNIEKNYFLLNFFLSLFFALNVLRM